MRIKYTDSDVEYTSLVYDVSSKEYVISDGNQTGITYEPVLGLIQDYEPSHFDYHLFVNDSPNCRENSIYQVYVGSVRIGWIFPIQALCSAEHDYAHDKYFLKYAYVATSLLLASINDIDNRQTPSEFFIEDYYKPEKSILVIDNDNTKSIENFCIDDYIVSLYKYGYSKNGRGNVDACPLDIGRKRISLKALPRSLGDTHYINALFQEQLPIQEDDITKFYFIYQLIEVLINIVFEHQFMRITNLLNTNPDSLFEIRDELNEIGKEKFRIGKLFSSYANKIEAEFSTDLNNACCRFLTLNGLSVKNQYWENLYAVRCFLVHKLYSVNSRSLETLSDINRCFIALIIEVLLIFEKPSG